MTAATTEPASADAPKTDSRGQSCYGSARDYTAVGDASQGVATWRAYSYATTTSACADINVKTNYSRWVRVCFERTASCNDWTPAYVGQWTVVADDVDDGTKFWLVFKGSNNSTGMAAY
ncbi:hypothetical protein [Streptomyces sp. 7N604]|uniref:hypothetical protein n=1 Tax=Streptomyces sp. 7N604 TaxID=3457415 RepID=UPI003FD249BA